MPYRFDPHDVAFLDGAAGREALAVAQDLPLTDSSLLSDVPTLRPVAGVHTAAVVETVRLRRRAATKLGQARASHWLLTDEALQQASPWPVALHRAGRLTAAGAVHDVTCSVGTDLAALVAAGAAPVLGSDLDPVRVAMAAANVPGVAVLRADALHPASRTATVYADPARRADGRRTTGVATRPSVAQLRDACTDRPLVLRLPPGIDYDHMDTPGEVEIVSLDGTAREAVLWPPEFAAAGVRRRASVLRTDSAPLAITDAEPDGGPDTAAGAVDGWLVDPDPAIVRAHLVRRYAARHGLHLLDPHLAYLTGPRPVPAVRCFEVLDTAPYSERTVAGWIRRDRVGTLEIKQRGTPVVPDVLRRKLRRAMSGDTTIAATLVIARIGAAPQAFWCRADHSGSRG